jgi:YggT family protein
VTAVRQVLYFIVLIFFITLIGRLIIDWIQVFARDWRPRGVVLVIAEAVYSVTDPPLKALRRVLPPLTIGQVQIDLAFIVIFLIVSLLLSLLSVP